MNNAFFELHRTLQGQHWDGEEPTQKEIEGLMASAAAEIDLLRMRSCKATQGTWLWIGAIQTLTVGALIYGLFFHTPSDIRGTQFQANMQAGLCTIQIAPGEVLQLGPFESIMERASYLDGCTLDHTGNLLMGMQR